MLEEKKKRKEETENIFALNEPTAHTKCFMLCSTHRLPCALRHPSNSVDTNGTVCTWTYTQYMTHHCTCVLGSATHTWPYCTCNTLRPKHPHEQHQFSLYVTAVIGKGLSYKFLRFSWQKATCGWQCMDVHLLSQPETNTRTSNKVVNKHKHHSKMTNSPFIRAGVTENLIPP